MDSLWDSQDINALHDNEFISLLQKQFSASNDPGLNFMVPAVNPQSLSSYSLPSLTPPSEDSSPSPSNSNQDNPNDDAPDPALKRKASDDDLEDGPSQKTQHTASKASSSSRRKSTGTGTGKDETRLLKRKEQNRAAQRAFRERKEKHVKDLEDKVADLEAKNEQAHHENENLRDLLTRLQTENVVLKESAFTFSVAKNAASTSSPASPPASSVTSPVASELASPKYTNPLDWSSLTSFNPTVLNLLDDTLPQPTATEGAMQMDFGFGTANPTGLASNAPYTTIASNPMFMSFASTFDSLSPASTDNTAPVSATYSPNISYPFDMNSVSPWPTPLTSQDAILDDLFSGYLEAMNSGDFPMLTQSPASNSPVTHHLSPAIAKNQPSPLASSSSSPLTIPASDPLFMAHREPPSIDAEPVHVEGGTCPKTKAEMQDHIDADGASPFAPAVRKSSDHILGTMISCAGSKFPKTVKSDQNIEVLSAWRSITSNPKFKDVDINDLCGEFTSKARCDGTKVVLEPSGVHSILESLSKKQ